jgi:hypothetical protein
VAVQGFAALDRRIEKLSTEIVSGKSPVKLCNAVGLMAKASVQMTGAASLGGDYKFSRWPKASELQVKYQLTKKPGGVVIHRAPRSAGPWRVAEEGVKAQTKGDKLEAGFRKNKNGTVVQKYKKSKRTTKGTSGQGSWTAFEAIVMPKVSPLIEREVKASLFRAVTGV